MGAVAHIDEIAEKLAEQFEQTAVERDKLGAMLSLNGI